PHCRTPKGKIPPTHEILYKAFIGIAIQIDNNFIIPSVFRQKYAAFLRKMREKKTDTAGCAFFGANGAGVCAAEQCCYKNTGNGFGGGFVSRADGALNQRHQNQIEREQQTK
ncbi:MAG: hypothetical protein ACOYI3_04445, partial [Christensenellales bacterium]